MSPATLDIDTAPRPLVIGATGLEDIEQCLRVIVSTFIYSVPMDRAFAVGGKFLDAPSPVVIAHKIRDIADAIEKYEPRVEVTNIDYSAIEAADLMDGRLFPVITFRVKDGVEL